MKNKRTDKKLRKIQISFQFVCASERVLVNLSGLEVFKKCAISLIIRIFIALIHGRRICVSTKHPNNFDGAELFHI
jgi:hypothetical protein